ncbi:hypothetical protein KFE25_010535 [Diacronema lutheri]|uniref:Cytosolic Fe-S cluster assembly factor NUBP1 homolog n=1 Tax=Diacronema lutheri TaxID=2081491 RepID=A0A8J6CBC8_DIALT|nr:hypothetical protein KFE25_010535 [Diacronema lutheri]
MALDHPQPENCVGPQSEEAGKASACEGCPNQKVCASGAAKEEDPAVAQVAEQLASVKRKVLVLSGKGGVGKSTVASQLAFGLASRGLRVGLLDIDICGPSAPLMLGVRGEAVHSSASGWSPVWVSVPTDAQAGDGDEAEEGELGVMSIGFLLPDADDAVIWRGPRKNGLIKQFLTDVEWGSLDVLLIDTPPGTSDEHISAVQYMKRALGEHDGAVVVSTPQEASMADVRKELNFCKKTSLRVLGVVENMAPLAVPLQHVRAVDTVGVDVTARLLAAVRAADPALLNECLLETIVFPTGAGSPANAGGSTPGRYAGLAGPERMAAEFGVPFLGKLPLDPAVGRACDAGQAIAALGAHGRAAVAVRALCDRVARALFPDVGADGGSAYRFAGAPDAPHSAGLVGAALAGGGAAAAPMDE